MTTRKGTPGNDTLSGGTGPDRLFGDLGNDVLNGLAGRDQLFGGEGNDKIDGGLDDDSIAGGLGADSIQGGDGDDMLSHADGFNTFGEESAKDVINGGAGNDFIAIGAKDTAIGGQGIDLLTLNIFIGPSANYRLNFSNIGGNPAAIAAAGTALAGTLVGTMEAVNAFIGNALAGSQIIGSNGDDSLSMSVPFGTGVKGVTLLGGNGDDSLTGSDRNDTLNGGAGHDDLDGGDGGIDTLIGGTGEDAFLFRVDDFGPASPDRINDFAVGQDIIAIGVDFTSSLDFGDQSNLLLKTATAVNGTTAAGTAQLIYETSTGKLFLDENGAAAGGLEHLMTLVNKANITAANVLIEYDVL